MSAPSPEPRALVTLRQAAEQRPWATERYLRRLVSERRIPFHKVGAKILLDLADIDAFTEAGRVEMAAGSSRARHPANVTPLGPTRGAARASTPGLRPRLTPIPAKRRGRGES